MRVILLYDGTEESEKVYIQSFSLNCKELNIPFEHRQIYRYKEITYKKEDVIFIDIGGLVNIGLGNNHASLRNVFYRMKELSNQVWNIYLITHPTILRYALEDEFLSQFSRMYEVVGDKTYIGDLLKTIKKRIEKYTKKERRKNEKFNI